MQAPQSRDPLRYPSPCAQSCDPLAFGSNVVSNRARSSPVSLSKNLSKNSGLGAPGHAGGKRHSVKTISAPRLREGDTGNNLSRTGIFHHPNKGRIISQVTGPLQEEPLGQVVHFQHAGSDGEPLLQIGDVSKNSSSAHEDVVSQGIVVVLHVPTE